MIEMKIEFFQKDKSFPFFIQYGYHSGDFFKHVHKDFTELVIVMDGSADHIVGTEMYPVSQGDVFVVGNNVEHEFRNAKKFKPCNIMFRQEFFFHSSSRLKETEGFHALFYLEPYMTKESEFRSRFRLSKQGIDKVFQLTESLMQEYKERVPGWKELITAYFMELVVFLARTYKIPEPQEQDKVIWMASAVSYIEKNYQNEISLEEIADKACLSKRHFVRIFRDTYHITPMQYVIQLRLEHAAVLLTNTTDLISKIAEESGFPDNNYFSRRFKSYYNMTPGEFRKRKH
ncbi:AraC family transcriptional regulator [Anaeromicropila populeti]|uniref:AraC family transcriptional regulator, L-rhamnose operon regulatory protein RhaS n=1 Tax=Anaeromicropila populeti TaxID=37658 RepID=A0A1I6KAI5_9FIRM|nr:AraC family transcriptional regulator [Anaeromicropila populeti]SFR88295.1 AraC family transcriptional regulator, L-rhamnose operon regulatory protein RhaS [Anaeromicropila populeti]